MTESIRGKKKKGVRWWRRKKEEEENRLLGMEKVWASNGGPKSKTEGGAKVNREMRTERRERGGGS